MSNGLSDHELLLEVREDVSWIKEHLGQVPPRKEVYGVLVAVITISLTVLSLL